MHKKIYRKISFQFSCFKKYIVSWNSTKVLREEFFKKTMINKEKLLQI